MNDFFKNIFGGPKIDLLPIVAEGAVILDVRNPNEFAGGHVKNEINIPVDELESRIKEIQDLEKPILAYCKSGKRSGRAVSLLKSRGFEAFNAGSKGEMENLLNMAFG